MFAGPVSDRRPGIRGGDEEEGRTGPINTPPLRLRPPRPPPARELYDPLTTRGRGPTHRLRRTHTDPGRTDPGGSRRDYEACGIDGEEGAARDLLSGRVGHVPREPNPSLTCPGGYCRVRPFRRLERVRTHVQIHPRTRVVNGRRGYPLDGSFVPGVVRLTCVVKIIRLTALASPTLQEGPGANTCRGSSTSSEGRGRLRVWESLGTRPSFMSLLGHPRGVVPFEGPLGSGADPQSFRERRHEDSGILNSETGVLLS